MNLRLAAVLATVVLGFGCGGKNAGSGESNQTVSRANAPCEMTLAGGVTATLPCTVVAGWDSSKNQVMFEISGAPQGPVTNAQIALAVPGAFHTGTYSSASSNNYAATVMIGGTAGVPTIWVSAANPVRGGGITINITSEGPVISTSGGTAYTVHGSADASLAATVESGASGTITMHSTF